MMKKKKKSDLGAIMFVIDSAKECCFEFQYLLASAQVNFKKDSLIISSFSTRLFFEKSGFSSYPFD